MKVKWFLTCCSLLLFFAACNWFGPLKEDPDRLYNEANRLLSIGEFAEAEKKFLFLIKSLPENPRPYNNLGNLYATQGEEEKARKQYKMALDLNPGYLIARLNLAVLSLNHDETEEAYRWLQEGLKNYPENAALQNGLGVCELRRGNVQKAITYFRKAIDIEGAKPEYYNNLAFAYAECNQFLLEALKLAKEAMKGRSENPVFLDTVGWVYFKRGVFDQAIENLENALSYNPKSEAIRLHLITIYRWMGNNGKVTELIKDGIRVRVMDEP